MRLIFIGPPGSGKGTQTGLLGGRLGLRHIGTGDIFREAMRQDTPAGQLVKPYVDKGVLVPDDIVNQTVADLFAGPNRPENFVLDGYPRTLHQAQAFDRVLKEGGPALDAVVVLVVPDEELIRRLSARWSCPNPACNATFHTIFQPPKKTGVCDRCQSALKQRPDDTEETVRQRLKVYHGNFSKLLDYYRQKGLLREVPGVGDVETIFSNILHALEKK